MPRPTPDRRQVRHDASRRRPALAVRGGEKPLFKAPPAPLDGASGPPARAAGAITTVRASLSGEETMNRRELLSLMGVTAAGLSIPGLAAAQAQKEMVTVVKIAGIPWFNAVEKGIQKGGKDFGVNASMVGPANVDPAQQVK